MLTGLTYAKLCSLYPAAGGAQYFAYRRFGPFHGFLAGWGLLLDYIVDIALFSLASVGYLGFLVKELFGSDALLASPNYALAATALVALLTLLNLAGIKASSKFNELIVLTDLVTLALVLGAGGILLALSGSLRPRVPALGSELPVNNFLYAVTISMASYIGVEAASQVAEEVRDARRDVPRAILLAVAATVIVALIAASLYAFSGSLSGEDVQHPLSSLASRIPVIGAYLAVWTGLLGTILNAASANSGVIGVSRVVYSMSRVGLLPGWLRAVNKRGSPHRAVTFSSSVAASLLLFHAFLPGAHLVDLMASLYNFGALLAYMYAHAALISVYRNPHLRLGKAILPMLGLAACAIMWGLLFALHEEGRVLALAWIAAGLLIYALSFKAQR
uniref:APC family permease n=1 Tax=Thermofilum pendens TaxID=2269 RepID=A0A7J3X954_THEPE